MVIFNFTCSINVYHQQLLKDLPTVDVVVTMGCNMNCPYLPCEHSEDWGIEDVTGKSDEELCCYQRDRKQDQEICKTLSSMFLVQ